MKEDLVSMLFEVPGETVRVHKGDSLFSEGTFLCCKIWDYFH